MKRFGLYIIILYNMCLLTGCRDSVVPPETLPRAEAERTVIIYLVGDNSLSTQVRQDTLEMVKGKSFIPEDVNFIIYLDDKAHKPAIYELSAKKGMQLWKQCKEELCSTKAEVMLNILQLIKNNFPARHYGITFWSHATGWTPRRNTFGKDETHSKLKLHFSDTGAIPAGWRCVQENNEVHEYPNSFSLGARTMSGFSGYQGKALYWREECAEYGRQDSYPLTLEPGDYKLTYAMAAWKSTPKFKVSILDAATDASISASEVFTASPNANGNSSANVSTAAERELEFSISTAGNYVISFTNESRSCGYDEYLLLSCNLKYADEMEIPVLRDVLSRLPKFDYIFFDACFMQCIEVAYELRNVTSYMVGSPAEIPGPGAPYDKVISALCKGDAKGIVEGYDSGYPGTYNYYYYPGVLLSCIDCSQLDALAEATGRLLTPFYMEHAEPSADGFQAYCSFLNKYTHYFDMRTTMCRLLSEDDYTAWMELFDKAVPLRKLSSSNTWFASFCSDPTVRDPECYGGVSMFVPMEKYNNYGWNEDFQKTSWYAVTGWQRTGW